LTKKVAVSFRTLLDGIRVWTAKRAIVDQLSEEDGKIMSVLND
jgi:hypothetical protein